MVSDHHARGLGGGVIRPALVLIALAPMAHAMDAPLTGQAGDPVAGRAIVVEATKGLCILCHAGPWPDVPFMGDLAPDLTGVGAALTVAELRQRIVDSRVVMPQTIMPPYHATEGLTRVGATWQGQPILTAQEVEDVVAYLATLTDPKEESR